MAGAIWERRLLACTSQLPETGIIRKLRVSKILPAITRLAACAPKKSATRVRVQYFPYSEVFPNNQPSA
jgi:hypothetical protein